MSHNNYPYGRPAADYRSDSGPDSDHQPHSSGDYSLYRGAQEASHHPTMSSSSSSSSSYPPPSSRAVLAEPGPPQRVPDQALSLLSSCGLEPKDLAVLAELPEHLLTMENLPGLLVEIKSKRRAAQSSSSAPPSSRPPPGPSHPPPPLARPPPTGGGPPPPPPPTPNPPTASSSEWEQIRSQPVRYPLDHSYRDPEPKPLPPEQVASWQDRWGNPRQTGAASYKPPGSSSSSSGVEAAASGYPGGDYGYGKQAKERSSSVYERPSYGAASGDGGGGGKAPTFDYRRSSGSADYSGGKAPVSARPDSDYRRSSASDYNNRPGSQDSSSRMKGLGRMPSRKAALDFHGEPPQTFPYSCSLCDITVLSEKAWTAHANGPGHADGQLSLLQVFPDWDCRLESVSKSDDRPARPKDEGRTAPPSRRPNLSAGKRPENSKSRRTKEAKKTKVICAKFADRTYDEGSLRRLAEQFGKVVKIMFFPSLAFVEMGSQGQAEDLVKYYTGNPVETEGKTIIFHLSSTFSFLQSSRVVSFTPAPVGEDGYLDLMVIAKRFGQVVYSLFLPSMAFVEMANGPDTEKLVDYYSSHSLKIDGVSIQVTFSSEYNTLMNVPSVRKYEENADTQTKRTPSPKRRARSQGSDSPPRAKRERSDSPPRAKRPRRSSRSRDRGDRSSASRDRGDRSSRGESSRRSRSSSRHGEGSPSSEKNQGPDKTLPPDAAQPASTNPQTNEKTEGRAGQTKTPATAVEPASTNQNGQTASTNQEVKTSTTTDQKVQSEAEKTRPAGGAQLVQAEAEAGRPEEEEEEQAGWSADSDIEGMEVIGEDGESLQDESMEAEAEAACPEEERTRREAGASGGAPEEEKEEEERRGRSKEEDAPAGSADDPEDEDLHPDFPESLDDCITLDELSEEEEEEEEEEDEDKRRRDRPTVGRVLYIRDLPQRFYTDTEFVRMLKGYGKIVRYFLLRNRLEGFIEMSSSDEAFRMASELRSKPIEFHGARLNVVLSRKYRRLTRGVGWKVESDSGSDSERKRVLESSRARSTRRRRRTRSRSRSKSKTSEREDSTRKTSDKTAVTKTTEKEDSDAKEDSAKKTTKEEEGSSENTTATDDLTENTTEKKDLTEKAEEGTESTAEKRETEAKKNEVTEKCVGSGEAGSITQEERVTTDQPSTTSDDEKDGSMEVLQTGVSEQQQQACSPEEEAQRPPDPPKTRTESPPPDPPKTSMESSDPQETGTESSPPDPQKTSSESSPTPSDPPKTSTESSDPPKTSTESSSDPQQTSTESSDPQQTSTESFKPTSPVGREFIRPVVGYFCHLCQVIYADEDEAKNQHCSSQSHYSKYMEHKGKDS